MLRKIVLFCIISTILLSNLQFCGGGEVAQKECTLSTNENARITLSYQLTNQTIQILSGLRNVSMARATTYLYYYNPSDRDNSTLHRLRRADLLLEDHTLIVLNLVKDSLDLEANAHLDLAQTILVSATGSTALALSVDCANLAMLFVAFYYLVQFWKDTVIVTNMVNGYLANNWDLIYLSDMIPTLRSITLEEADFFDRLANGSISWDLSTYKTIKQKLESDKAYLDAAVGYTTTLFEFYGPMILNSTPGTPPEDRNNDGIVNESDDYRIAVVKFFERLKTQFETERNFTANLLIEFPNVTQLPMPTLLSISPSKFRIRENTTKSLTAMLTDGNDEGIPGKVITWSATNGSFDTNICVTNTTGECEVIYNASEWGDAEIAVAFANESGYLGSSHKISGYVIPLWSLLASTPWPKHQKDAQNTGRSDHSINWDRKYPLWTKWVYDTNETYTGEKTLGAPIIGTDAIYVTSKHKLYALDFNGGLKWIYNITNISAFEPMLRQDGVVYVVAKNNLYAINPNGTLRWNTSFLGDAIYPPAIGWDGSVYVTCSNILYAFNPDGTLFWSVVLDDVLTPPAVSNDGTIYIVEYSYGADCTRAVAIDMYGNIKWRSWYTLQPAGKPWSCSSPVIGVNGTIYFTKQRTVDPKATTLFALNPNTGTAESRYDVWYEWDNVNGVSVLPQPRTPPAIDKDGKIYIGMGVRGDIYIPQGIYFSDYSMLWRFNQTRGLESKEFWHPYYTSPLTLDTIGIIYVGYWGGIMIITPEGPYYYEVGLVKTSPTINLDGTVYVSTANGKIYAIAQSEIDIICVDSPTIVKVNETFNFSAIIKNVGTDIAYNVSATIYLPTSISTTELTKSIDDGALYPGELSVVTWTLKGKEIWMDNIIVGATSDNGSDSGWLYVAIIKEFGNISILNIDCPTYVYVGEKFNLSFTIKNEGDEYLTALYAMLYLPKGSLPYSYLSHDYYGISTQDPEFLDVIDFPYNALAPNETVDISWNLTAINKGRYTITVYLYSYYAGLLVQKFAYIAVEVYDTTVLNVTYNNVSGRISITTNVNVLNPIFNSAERKVTFILSAANGTKGLCNLTIPKSLIPANATLRVYIDNESVDFVLTENLTCYLINFTCEFSRKYITITWDLPKKPVSGVSMVATLIYLTPIILVLTGISLILLWLFMFKKKKFKK